MNLKQFAGAGDMAVRLDFNGYQRRLYVTGSGRASLPMEAWSGGGQTSAINRARRHTAQRRSVTSVPTTDFPFDSFRAASDHDKIDVVSHEGATKRVARRRGGVLPPGEWIAVARDAPEFRPPNSSIGQDRFSTWWLYPRAIGAGFAHSARQLDTFYIHVAGFLGSDGCIVMAPDNLALLARHLRNRPYTFLRSATFEGPELDVVADRSTLA